MLSIPDTSRVSNFHSARRYLRTDVESFIVPGDVINVDGVLFIVADHGTGFYQQPIYKHFKLFQVDLTAQWFKTEDVMDPVTGVISHSYETTPTLVYLSTQPKPSIDDQLKVQTLQITAICNVAVNLSDKVGEYKVTKVDSELGVYALTMKVI